MLAAVRGRLGERLVLELSGGAGYTVRSGVARSVQRRWHGAGSVAARLRVTGGHALYGLAFYHSSPYVSTGLATLGVEAAQRLEGLFFDLDDTLLHEGKLRKHAYASLFHLAQSGLRLMALTGRPARWAELIARMWPVEAAIAENGALGFGQVGRRVSGFDFLKTEVRLRHRARLERLVTEARRQIPELLPADDATARVSDFTFDIGEFEQADESTIALARRRHSRHSRTMRSSSCDWRRPRAHAAC